MNDHRRLTVPVRGGELVAAQWGPDDGIPVLAVHGVTASHLSFAHLTAAMPDARLIAPDLRGRGRSSTLPGPWGMSTHADDLAALLDHLGIDRALVVGHSMGAFVSLVLADRHPGRVTSLVLVDGGLPLPAPEGISDDEAMKATLGPAAERLAMTFPSRERYREFWRKHPAFAGDWGPEIEAYVDYDLVGEEPELHPASSVEAMIEDSRELRGGSSHLKALDGLQVPAIFLRAPRGLLDETPPLYPEEQVETWLQRYPAIASRLVPGVNHYTIVMSDRGAAAVATAIVESATAVAQHAEG